MTSRALEKSDSKAKQSAQIAEDSTENSSILAHTTTFDCDVVFMYNQLPIVRERKHESKGKKTLRNKSKSIFGW